MYEAVLTIVDMSGTDLKGTILEAEMSNVSSGGITGVPKALPGQTELIDGYLIGGSFELRGAELTDATLTGDDLVDTDLTEANLTDANMADADLYGANLTSANLTRANLVDATLTDVNLTGADLTGADLTGADLPGVGWWSDTTCPDGTISDNDGGTCADDLTP